MNRALTDMEREQRAAVRDNARRQRRRVERAERPRITRTVLRRYSDTGQSFVYVEWSDGSRTECDAERASKSRHMQALLSAARRAGLDLVRESW